MPCRDWEGDNSSFNTIQIQRLEEENRTLEAMLCALMNTLSISYPNSKEDIIDEAENQGKVDIRSWFDKHNKNDINRLKKKLNKTFSNHELEIIKGILNK